MMMMKQLASSERQNLRKMPPDNSLTELPKLVRLDGRTVESAAWMLHPDHR
jgi:hypothetical protein